MFTSIILLCTIVFLFLYSFYKFSFYRPPNFPPGPPRLPVWGSYWILLFLDYKFPARALHWLSKFYKSSLIGIHLGEFPAVVVHGAENVKELFTRQEFDGRMDVILGRLRANGEKLGILFTDGVLWHEQRRFSLRYMRDWGFGRRCPRLEQLISDEISIFLDFLRSPPKDQDVAINDLICLPDVFYVPLINSLLGVLQGQAMDPSKSARLTAAGRNALVFQRSGDDLGGALSFTPWLRHFAPHGSGYVPLVKSNQNLVDLVKDVIEECKENMADEYDSNFFDKYIRTMKEINAKQSDSTFSEEQLVLIGVDFLFPTTSTNSVTLSLLIRELIQRPDIQDRIHAEIDSVVGQGRLPGLDDRFSLSYTEACIREAMRRVPLVPLGIPHRAVKDTTFNGYSIPKDTMMVANMWSYHMDPEIWGDPEVFRPERFLDNNGQILKKDISLPFGSGKRICAGETFARQIMFRLFSAIMQNFIITSPKKKFLPKLVPGIITSPENFWVQLTPRK